MIQMNKRDSIRDDNLPKPKIKPQTQGIA